ncbi:MAG: flagellar hook-associated protein FlgK [Acetobacteraceae bacterium]
MSLDAALSIAMGGLANVNRQMALVSQNVANAGTPDYVAQVGSQESLTAEGTGLGVATGVTTRRIDLQVQATLYAQEAVVAGLDITAAALGAVDASHGTPGQGDDLASLVGGLRDGFSSLLGTPGDQTAQTGVVVAADDLARRINGLSQTYGAQRQSAHDDMIAALDTMNAALHRIGTLSNQIIALKSGGRSSADLENQRDAALHTLSGLVGVKALVKPNGDMLVFTSAGLGLPTRYDGDAFQLAPAALQPGTAYPATVPGIMMNGRDVTRQMTGGRIGADLALRDTTLPTFQAELDEFAQNLASRFDAQGLTLFTDPTGAAVPAANGTPTQAAYVGFAGIIGVNPAVRSDPSLIRDGTTVIAGSATGASAFTPNPAGGPAGFTTMIRRVLDFAMGAEAQTGVPQPTTATAGLGVDGNLAAPYAPPATLADQATALVAAQARESADTTSRLTDEQGYRDGLSSRLSAGSGVNLDTEMAMMLTLQTAYGANARIMSVIQSLFSDLMATVR